MDNREIAAWCKQRRIDPAALIALIEILGPEEARQVIQGGIYVNHRLDSAGVASKASQKDYSNDGVGYLMSKVFRVNG